MKLILSLVALAVGLTACGAPASDANTAEHAAQQRDSQELVRNQAPPVETYSQYRQNAIEIQHAEMEGIQSTSFIMGSSMSPDPIETCPSIGMPIPVTASVTNPHQVIGQWIGGAPNDTYSKFADGVVDQMDPNGLYTGDGAGTYVMCIDATGQANPVYAEGLVTAVFGPATWDYAHHRIQMTGPASFHFSAGQGK